MDLRGLGGPAAVSWAKTGPDGTWLSLADHAADAAVVAEWLWDVWLPRQVTDRISAELGGAGTARTVVMWLAAIHDVGKLSPQFAAKGTAIPDVLDGMRAAGLPVPSTPSGAKPYHGDVGQVAVRAWLKTEFGVTPAVADTLAAIVGGHHGIPPEAQVLREVPSAEIAFGSVWSDARHRMISDVTVLLGAHESLKRVVSSPPSIDVQALLAAVVVMADWLASNTNLFPVGEIADGRECRGLDALPFTSGWEPERASDSDSLFASRFPGLSAPNTLQRNVFDVASQASEPPLMIVEAGMGRGKTEAALLAAEVLAARFGAGGIFVGLPTTATATAMFGRLLEWSSTWERSEPVEVSLAHSKAALAPAFAGIRDAISGVHDDGCTAVASTWFAGQHTHLLATLVAGTVDQFLRSALKSRHVPLRMLAFAGKVVVIDEVHAADDIMRVFLRAALTWLGMMRTPVILLSATLPPAQRTELVTAYATGRGVVNVSVPDAPGYPVVTCFDGHVTSTAVTDTTGRRQIAVRPLTSSLVDLLTQELADGGVAGVIRSTVASAQATFAELDAAFPGDVVLLHSALMACQRADREERLVNQLGRGGSRPNRLIVVSTQVIEQSLDIDLDVLVTDLGPVDSVLQRIGRLHRHQTSVRPERLSNPVVFIDHVPMNRAVEPFLERGAHAVYGAKNLLSSAFVLRGHLAGQPLTLDDDIPGLVAAAYGDLALPQPWAAVVDAETKSTDTTARVTVRDAYVLRPTMTRMTGMLHCHADDSVSSTMVRDGELGVEVILVRKTGDRTVTGMPGTALNGRELSLDVTPSRADAAQLAGCVVRLPLRVSRRLLGRADIREPAGLTFPAWRRSALLADALVLPVADDGAVLAGLTVSYDQAIGLTVS